MHTFHVYKCSKCGRRETYAAKMWAFRCDACGAAMDHDGTRSGTLTLHPRTGRLAVEEDLRWPDDYRQEDAKGAR